MPEIDPGSAHFLEGYIHNPLKNMKFHGVSARNPCIYYKKS